MHNNRTKADGFCFFDKRRMVSIVNSMGASATLGVRV